jgi:hypothetical protein
MPDPSILAENFDIEAAHAKLEPAIHHLSRMRQMAYDERSVDKLRALQAMQEEFRNVSQAIMGLMQNRRARSGIVLPEARA